MTSVSENSNPRRVPRGMLGMLALVAVLELIVGRCGAGLSSLEATCWRQSGEAARAVWVRSADLLCLGTSMVKYGVLPRIIEERTGKRAVNLAVVGGPMPASYFLLRRALEAGSHPSALIVDCEDPNIERGNLVGQSEAYLFRTRLWSELLDVHDLLDLSWSARDAEFFARTCLFWVSPTLRARNEIRSALQIAARGGGDLIRISVRDALRVHQANWRDNRGALVLAPSSRDRERAAALPSETLGAGPETAVPDDRLLVETLSGHYALRLARLAEAHRITVYWLLPPLSAQSQAHRIRTGEDTHLVLLARTLQATSPNVVVIDGRGVAYDPSAFADLSHLDRRGAATFSRALATVVALSTRDRPPSPSWIPLPRHRGPLFDSPHVKDLSQTTLLLKRQRVIR